MQTFLLTWNPDKWDWSEDDYADAVERTAAGRTFHASWSTGNRRSGISVGDRALLLRQARDRGMVASGYFSSAIYEDNHWDNSGRTASYAKVDFDVVLPVEDRLYTEELIAAIPGVPWNNLMGSGVQVSANSSASIEAMWSAHTAAAPYRSPGELAPTYEEGELTRISVNRYERDRKARVACIKHHGLTCVVCGFNFEQAYGELGQGVVHVHHLQEISRIGHTYEVDPVKDLVPLCANCHVMAHRRRPALSPEQLRRLLTN